MTFGISPTGFVRKTQADVIDEFETKIRARVDANADQDPESPQGQLNGIIAEQVAENWEVLEEAYHAYDPNSSEGDALTNISQITGTDPRAATFSVVPVSCNLNAGSTAPQHSVVAVVGRDDITFELDTDITNPGGSPANITGTATATNSGPVQAFAGVAVIKNAAPGWNSVTFTEDAALGHVADTEITLRQRRQNQLALRGGTTVDAIAADLLTIPEIQDVLMLENTKDHFDPVTGLSANSFEALISDNNLASDNKVAQSILNSKSGGIAPKGTTFGIAIDKRGVQYRMPFSRAEYKDVYIVLSLAISGLFPGDGIDQVKRAILARCDQTFGVADDVIGVVIEAAALSVAGVTDTVARLGFLPNPIATDNLPIGLHQRARFAAARIDIEFDI